MNVAQDIKGVVNCTFYDNGTMDDCTVNEKNVLHTSVGTLIPRYAHMDFRTKNLKSLSFYEDGSIRSVSLDEQTAIDTPLGTFPAELVTFYQDGVLNSVFPLNGQMGFGWSEEEEGALAKAYDFAFPFGDIQVKLNGMRFYPNGSLKSLMFWPGETVPLTTPAGDFSGRTGIQLFDDGALRSFEPATPVMLDTPIGTIRAYDVDAIAVTADFNSVTFDHEGDLERVKMSGDVVVQNAETGRKVISSRTRLGLEDDTRVKLPLIISFKEEGHVRVDDGIEAFTFPLEGSTFLALSDFDLSGLTCSSGCDACAGCE